MFHHRCDRKAAGNVLLIVQYADCCSGWCPIKDQLLCLCKKYLRICASVESV